MWRTNMKRVAVDRAEITGSEETARRIGRLLSLSGRTGSVEIESRAEAHSEFAARGGAVVQASSDDGDLGVRIDAQGDTEETYRNVGRLSRRRGRDRARDSGYQNAYHGTMEHGDLLRGRH